MAERAEKNPYRQFSLGQSLSFTLHTLNPDGSVFLSDKQVEISAIKDGGFFGRVLIPKDEEFVIKTSVPDPWHDLWRRVNWGFRDFPSQVSETQAQLDHLATNLIHDTLPFLTEGRFYSPRSLGYTKLPTGFAQVLEKIDGRGPRFDTANDEYERFRQTQPELTRIGLNLGLEHAAQIHTDNPFGMANLWLDEENSLWIWLDTLPAIPHQGWVWPLFYFRFHRDIRHWFYPETEDLTFNRIHPDMFLEEIRRNRHLFNYLAFQKILDNLALYQSLWEKRQQEDSPPRNIRGVTRALTESAKDFLPKVIKKPLNWLILSPVRTIFDAKYRNSRIFEGVEQAFEEGMIDSEQLANAEEVINLGNLSPQESRKRKLVLGSLPVFYAINFLSTKFIEGSVYSYIIFLSNEDTLEKAAMTAAVGVSGRIIPDAMKFIGTTVIGRLTDTDLRTAARVSLVPIGGPLYAVAAQLAVFAGSKSELIWHYAVRKTIADLSSIHPAGGWGTQYEGMLWKLLGRRIENLAAPSRA